MPAAQPSLRHAPVRRTPARTAALLITLLTSLLAHALLLEQLGRTSDPVASEPLAQRLHVRLLDSRPPAAPHSLAEAAAAPPSSTRPDRPTRPLRSLHHSTARMPADGSIISPSVPPTEPSDAPSTAPPPAATDYLPSTSLDRPALPRSAPDPHWLDDVVLTGLPLRLRVCNDVSGQVTRVEALQASSDDAEAVAALQQMFRATAFVPGRRAGHDVASCADIDISIGPGTAR